MEKNRSHGKIDQLPPALRREVEDRLLNGDTYEQVSDYLKEQGEEVHVSSVGRYGKKFSNRFESVRVAKEFAKLLAEDNVDRPATELHEANNLLASQLIMEALIDDEMDAADRAKVAKSIASLQGAQVRNEKLKLEARKEQGAVHVAMAPGDRGHSLRTGREHGKRDGEDAVTGESCRDAYTGIFDLLWTIVPERYFRGLLKAFKRVLN